MTNYTRLANRPGVIINSVYLGTIDVVDEYTTIRTAIERHSKGLETLLPGGIPQLHSNQSVIDHNLLCQARLIGQRVLVWLLMMHISDMFSQVCANCSFVLVAEPLIDVLVH